MLLKKLFHLRRFVCGYIVQNDMDLLVSLALVLLRSFKLSNW